VPADVVIVITNATYNNTILDNLLAAFQTSLDQPSNRFTVKDTSGNPDDTTLIMEISAQISQDVNGTRYNKTADQVADLMISAWKAGDFAPEYVSLVAKSTSAPTSAPTPPQPAPTAAPTNSASNLAVSMALFVVLGLAYL